MEMDNSLGRKKKFYRQLIKFGIVMVLLLLIIKANSHASADYSKPTKIRCTCYLPTGNPCATGVMPTQGITVAGKREWFGKTCILYKIKKNGKIGKCLGFFEVQDTGGYYIRNGIRIDVFRNTMNEANKWIRENGDFVFMQLVDSEG